MDTDLLTEAKHLAERGWLPGIEWSDSFHSLISGSSPNMVTLATEADLHLAAHNEIVRRGWSVMVVTKHDTTTLYDWKLKDDSFEIDWEWSIERPGTTTLSLLRALRAACGEHERNEQETPNGS